MAEIWRRQAKTAAGGKVGGVPEKRRVLPRCWAHSWAFSCRNAHWGSGPRARSRLMMASWGCWHVAGRSQAWIRLRAPQIAEGLRVCVRVEVQVESLASACVRKLGNKESGINYKLHEYLGGSNGPALASAATVGCGRETAGKEGQERWLVSSKNSPSDGRGDPKRDPEYGAFGGRGCLWRILRAIPRYTICYYPIHTIWLELRRSFRPPAAKQQPSYRYYRPRPLVSGSGALL